jgi:protein-S-isoprenylcysteine O-methyltransferase Ste14
LKTPKKLVNNGIFHFIRHPMYASLLFLSWGIFFKSPSSLNFSLVIISTFFLYATARMDEKECIAKFGNEYLDYIKITRMFIPTIF